jgi:voltage-gated sodium channel
MLPGAMRGSIAETCRRIADSTTFQVFIVGVIVANAIVLGIDTYESIDRDFGAELSLLNDIFLAIFVLEIAIRIAAFGSRPQNYFRDGWNLFDFIVIAASFVPGIRENATCALSGSCGSSASSRSFPTCASSSGGWSAACRRSARWRC